MNPIYVLICTLIMAFVTYLSRVTPLVLFRKEINNKFIRSFLAYVPYAVLAAMTVPDVFFSTSNTISATIGFIAALILSYTEKSLLVVAAGSTVVVLIAETIMNFI